MAENAKSEIQYPRRRFIRALLRGVTHLLYDMVCDLKIKGRENLPQGGPLLVVINHFSYLDPALVVRMTPWPMEVLGGTRTPNAPFWGNWLLRLWGNLAVRRGTGARGALRQAEEVLGQGGIVALAPEGGSWAAVLRPPRPGVAFLAARTGARVLPIGIDGNSHVFPSLRRGRRARVTARIGKPLGPFHIKGRGQRRRQQVDEIGHEIMRHIAELIPSERRGYYADDPALRAAAEAAARYPWDNSPEI
jgi:1-acyl-sn-glycerol-3-phosphate acyltransferase